MCKDDILISVYTILISHSDPHAIHSHIGIEFAYSRTNLVSQKMFLVLSLVILYKYTLNSNTKVNLVNYYTRLVLLYANFSVWKVSYKKKFVPFLVL